MFEALLILVPIVIAIGLAVAGHKLKLPLRRTIGLTVTGGVVAFGLARFAVRPSLVSGQLAQVNLVAARIHTADEERGKGRLASAEALLLEARDMLDVEVKRPGLCSESIQLCSEIRQERERVWEATGQALTLACQKLAPVFRTQDFAKAIDALETSGLDRTDPFGRAIQDGLLHLCNSQPHAARDAFTSVKMYSADSTALREAFGFHSSLVVPELMPVAEKFRRLALDAKNDDHNLKVKLRGRVYIVDFASGNPRTHAERMPDHFLPGRNLGEATVVCVTSRTWMRRELVLMTTVNGKTTSGGVPSLYYTPYVEFACVYWPSGEVAGGTTLFGNKRLSEPEFNKTSQDIYPEELDVEKWVAMQEVESGPGEFTGYLNLDEARLGVQERVASATAERERREQDEATRRKQQFAEEEERRRIAATQVLKAQQEAEQARAKAQEAEQQLLKYSYVVDKKIERKRSFTTYLVTLGSTRSAELTADELTNLANKIASEREARVHFFLPAEIQQGREPWAISTRRKVGDIKTVIFPDRQKKPDS